MQLVDGRYKCNWCGTDLEAPFEDRDTMEIISGRAGDESRVIVVGGEERHRCTRPADGRSIANA